MTSADDDDLLALLRTAIDQADPVPDRVVMGARAAWTWRSIDAELAELVFDSAVSPTGSRSDTVARQLTFQAGDVEIELMVSDERSGEVVGQIVSDEPAAAMHMVWQDRRQTVALDDLGRFILRSVPSGPLCFDITAPTGRAVRTAWVTLIP